MAKHTLYRLYVPAEGAVHEIWAGSAIIGDLAENSRQIVTHYQGWDGHMAIDAGTPFEWCVQHAASRRFQRYPTAARRGWDPQDLIEVGSVEYNRSMRWWVVSDISAPGILNAWADSLVEVGGSLLLQEQRAGMQFMKLKVMDQAAAMKIPDRRARASYILSKIPS